VIVDCGQSILGIHSDVQGARAIEGNPVCPHEPRVGGKNLDVTRSSARQDTDLQDRAEVGVGDVELPLLLIECDAVGTKWNAQGGAVRVSLKEWIREPNRGRAALPHLPNHTQR